MNILLVEDSNVDAVLVQAHLNRSKSRFRVIRSDHLAAGLNMLQTEEVDVILLDLNLPDSMGIETFNKVHRKAPHIPIVVLSGQDDADMAIEAVSDGAQDYLPKSEATPNSLSRCIQYAVERSYRQRVEREISAAGEIQKRLFPQMAPVHAGFEFYGRCEPANLAGGDYFDYFKLQDGNQAIVIADVSGHGVGPALIMAQTRAVLRSLATTEADVGTILTRANRILSDDLEGDVFVSLLLLSLDPEARTIRFASGGHPGLVLDATGTVKERFRSNDPPLCVLPNHTYSTSLQVPLNDGDTVLLFTDGITEAMDSQQKQFGEQRMLDAVVTNHHGSSQEIVDSIFDGVRSHNQDSAQDDMTAVLFKIR